MAALGAPNHIYSKVTSASIHATLSQSSTPVGIDNPSFKDVEEIAVQLYKWEAVHTVTHKQKGKRVNQQTLSQYIPLPLTGIGWVFLNHRTALVTPPPPPWGVWLRR